MKTVFSASRMEFTKRAHLAAQTQFYPGMFADHPIEFEDTVGTVRDLEYAIDCQLAVTVDGFKGPLRFSVQERWRKPEFRSWGDVTITEWNLASGEPSELHKLGAHLFVYGFYDADADRIQCGITVNVASVLQAIVDGRLTYERRSRGDQSFVSIKVADLQRKGLVMFKLPFQSDTAAAA